MTKLTHLDEHGAARMVDVSGKEATDREAVAEAIVRVSADAFTAIAEGDGPKGDVLAAARIAGIMAAKKTADLIPLCHPIALSSAAVTFELLADENAVRAIATAKTTGPTGVEMEALTAASIAALTIYDMIKAIDKAAVIEAIRLVSKSGGKSGTFAIPESRAAPVRKLAKSTLQRPAAKVATLSDEIASRGRAPAGMEREAFRAFMTSHRLRATEWAKEAGVPAAQIYAYLTGRSRALPADVAERLAQAARVRVEDMFR